jgi:hypothetical protein
VYGWWQQQKINYVKKERKMSGEKVHCIVSEKERVEVRKKVLIKKFVFSPFCHSQKKFLHVLLLLRERRLWVCVSDDVDKSTKIIFWYFKTSLDLK